MPADQIARRSVAFFLIKSSVNFVAVAAIGTLMAVGLLGPDRSLLLTALPAALSVALIALVIAMPRIGAGRRPGPEAGRFERGLHAARAAVVDGARGARAGCPPRPRPAGGGDRLLGVGQRRAVGDLPRRRRRRAADDRADGLPIGQLGGLLPLPGGVGGIDGGLIGTLIVYGAPAAATAAAVLAYRVILFWVPLGFGALGFVSLRRALAEPQRADLREPALSPP